MRELRAELFARMQKLPISYFDANTNGSLMSYYTNDIEATNELLQHSITQMLISVTSLTGTIAMMLVLSMRLFAIMVVLGAIVLLVVRITTKISSHSYRAQQKNAAAVNGYIEEMIAGQRDIKVFTHEKQVMADFEPINEALYSASTMATTATSVVGPILNNLSHMFYAITCAVGTLWLTGEGTGGILITFLQYIRTFADRVSQIADQFNSIMLALAAMVMLFRPNKEEDAKEARKQDAQWVMLQDKKKLEACQAEEESVAAQVREALDEEGLGEAQGSVRQARALLDEAREARQAMALCRQRQQAAAARRADAEHRLQEIASERAVALQRAGLSPESGVGDVEEELERRVRQRTGLIEALESMNQRAGELAAVLAQAETERDFDRIKIEVQEVTTRLEEARTDFARLLLAKHMLEAAIATWESKRQPEVYLRASRLLSLMTEGRWTRVNLTREGTLEVADALGRTRQPVHLSLGTCQQLYLALRIALLTCADNVGRAIPILADDILVNFDEQRRLGAARALVELSEQRQVILFTCHEGVARALKKAAKQSGRPATVINL
mgnify:CR=1 FL=1